MHKKGHESPHAFFFLPGLLFIRRVLHSTLTHPVYIYIFPTDYWLFIFPSAAVLSAHISLQCHRTVVGCVPASGRHLHLPPVSLYLISALHMTDTAVALNNNINNNNNRSSPSSHFQRPLARKMQSSPAAVAAVSAALARRAKRGNKVPVPRHNSKSRNRRHRRSLDDGGAASTPADTDGSAAADVHMMDDDESASPTSSAAGDETDDAEPAGLDHDRTIGGVSAASGARGDDRANRNSTPMDVLEDDYGRCSSAASSTNGHAADTTNEDLTNGGGGTAGGDNSADNGVPLQRTHSANARSDRPLVGRVICKQYPGYEPSRGVVTSYIAVTDEYKVKFADGYVDSFEEDEVLELLDTSDCKRYDPPREWFKLLRRGEAMCKFVEERLRHSVCESNILAENRRRHRSVTGEDENSNAGNGNGHHSSSEGSGSSTR